MALGGKGPFKGGGKMAGGNPTRRILGGGLKKILGGAPILGPLYGGEGYFHQGGPH